MANEYRRQPEHFSLFSPDSYLELVVEYLERLDPRIVVERITSETPSDLLIAPDWEGLRNYQFAHQVTKRLKERGSWQGKCRTKSFPEPVL